MMEMLSQINSPLILLANVVISGIVLYWGHELFWKWSQNFSKWTTRFWALLFLFTGLGWLAASTSESFSVLLPPSETQRLLSLSVGLMITAAFLLFLTGVKSFAHPRWQRIMTVVGILIYVGILSFEWGNFDNKWRDYYFFPTLGACLVLNFFRYLKYRKTSHKFAFFGLMIMFVAELIASGKVDLGAYGPNLIYKLIYLSAFQLLYVGARYSTDHMGY